MRPSQAYLGYVSAVDSEERTIWIADLHRDGAPFVVRADEKLTAFVELESAIRDGKCASR
jgi:hypothetical protein